MEKIVDDLVIETVQGDITQLDVDVIVNAANSDLWMGSGVAGAIKHNGGIIIEKEAMAQGPISPGDAIITSAGSLVAKHVIHCAGMPPGGSATFDNVKSSVIAAMKLMKDKKLSTIAFPAIGAGVGGLSINDAVRAILEGISEGNQSGNPVVRVILVGYGNEAKQSIDNIVESWGE